MMNADTIIAARPMIAEGDGKTKQEAEGHEHGDGRRQQDLSRVNVRKIVRPEEQYRIEGKQIRMKCDHV